MAAVASTPTVADARLLAESLAGSEPLVERVLLFGSVARGDARSGSDYDLLVLLSDEAAPHFVEIARRLRIEAAQAVWSSDMAVRLASDWNHASNKVPASFDAAIAPEAVELVARAADPGDARRDSRAGPTIMPGVPVDDIDEAAALLDGAEAALKGVRARLRLVAVDEAAHADDAARQTDRRQRYMSVLSDAHLAVELAVKSVVAAEGGTMTKTHNIDNRVQAISDPATRQAVQELVEAVRGVGAIPDFRTGIYHIQDDDWQSSLTAGNAAAFARTAASVVALAADSLLRLPTSPENHATAARAKETAHSTAGLGITAEAIETGAAEHTP